MTSRKPVVYLTRSRPVTTEPQRREAIGSLDEMNPVWCTLVDELDTALAEETLGASARGLTPDERAYRAGRTAMVAELRMRLEELHGAAPVR